MFSILRCKANDTLLIARELRHYYEQQELDPSEVVCPTYNIVRRVGRNRERKDEEVAVLSGFLFVRHRSHIWEQHLETMHKHVKRMQRPGGGYATCYEVELQQIVAPNERHYEFKVGDDVRVTSGFLHGVTGRVLHVRQSGEHKISVAENRGWKISTLLAHGSVLASAHLDETAGKSV